MARKSRLEGRYFFYKMRGGHIIRVPIFSEKETEFIRRAKRMFLANCHWVEFDNFLFDPKSPLYGARRKNYPILKDPLFIVFKDMFYKIMIVYLYTFKVIINHTFGLL